MTPKLQRARGYGGGWDRVTCCCWRMELAIIARLPPCMASSTRLLHTRLRAPPNHRHTRSTFSSPPPPPPAIVLRSHSVTSSLRVEECLDHSSSSLELRGFGKRWKWTEGSTGKGACRGAGVRIWANGGEAHSGKRWALASVSGKQRSSPSLGRINQTMPCVFWRHKLLLV